ncbi:MAG: PqqD family peptide modification chaperone [Proteobacteria bacterium]|nr:PqqD family peptide modification chaperone [Pseudomonadota bacterium]
MKEKISIKSHTILSKNPDHISTGLDGETVLMSIQNSKYYGMDAIGSRIWDLLENGVSFHDLQTTLQQEFAGDPNRIKEDMMRFLGQLSQENLIVLNHAKNI